MADRELFPETAELNGHKGIHVGNGVYRLVEPFRINRDSWIDDELNRGYVAIGSNFSDDDDYCDLIYFSEDTEDTALLKLKSGLEGEPNLYGVVRCRFASKAAWGAMGFIGGVVL